MSHRPRLLDLFCGAGGAAVGYHRAGFEVVGVDIRPQPNYPFPFEERDAIDLLDLLLTPELSSLHDFDAIHASPPCQAHIKGLRAMNRKIGRADEHRDLIGGTRQRLVEIGVPWVIENVIGSPLLEPVRLCGTSLGLPLHRHRLFESSVPLLIPPCAHGLRVEQKYWNGDRSVRNEDGTRSYTGHGRRSSVVQIYGHAGERNEWPEALGIDWMTDEEMIEAIPPVYTELIGHQLLQHVRQPLAVGGDPE